MSNALLIDVGGTNMRYAVASQKSDDLLDIKKINFNENKFEEFLDDFIDENKIDIVIISIAGPKLDNSSIQMTKKNITFDSKKIKEKYNLTECILLNDWEAIAYSYDYIKEHIEYIKKGSPFNDINLYLGPGTGLGAAISFNNDIVVATEVGNTINSSFSMQKNYNINSDHHLFLEDFVSGSAISSIYKLKTDTEISSEEVYTKYKENDVIAEEVINAFIKSLAETLSDLALTFIPGNGILLAGSLIRTIYSDINKEEFIKLFIARRTGLHKELLNKISIGVITKEKTPLYGNLKILKKISS